MATTQVKDSVHFRKVGGEGIVYDTDHKKIHLLNPTACVVWELCSDGKSLDEIARKLSLDFGVPLETTTEDVAEILDNFTALDILGAPANEGPQ